MTNQEILTALQNKRKISAFAKFLGMTTAGVYALLKNNKKQYNQYGNFIEFMKQDYLSQNLLLPVLDNKSAISLPIA